MIEVRGISKNYRVPIRRGTGIWDSFRSLFFREHKTITALDHIDWEVKAGDIHALIGRNGSGKSTLVKILSGILFPTSGEAVVNGSTPWKNRTKYVKNIGVVFGHKSQLSWELPAIDTFELHKSLYSIDRALFRSNLGYLVTSFEAEEIISKPVRNLSLGERMKCEIICSLLHNPKVLFLDEPTIGLDLISKDQVRDAIRKINREMGTTIVLTSHDISDVSSLCNRISLIDHGRFLFRGSLEKLLEVHSRYKLITVELLKKVDDCYFNGFSVNKTGEYSFTMELDGERVQLQEHLAQLLQNLPVSDLNIESVKLEQIVKAYYETRSGKEILVEDSH